MLHIVTLLQIFLCIKGGRNLLQVQYFIDINIMTVYNGQIGYDYDCVYGRLICQTQVKETAIRSYDPVINLSFTISVVLSQVPSMQMNDIKVPPRL